MKPALHLIWSPLMYSIVGLLIAREIARIAPTESEFQLFVLIAMPAAGLFIGWFIAYLATPIKMRPDTTITSEALVGSQTGGKAAGLPTE